MAERLTHQPTDAQQARALEILADLHAQLDRTGEAVVDMTSIAQRHALAILWRQRAVTVTDIRHNFIAIALGPRS